MQSKPKVLVLGGNFAGLGSAQKIQEYCGGQVDITVIDRRNYLLYVPNIPVEVFENRDPALSLSMDLSDTLATDGVEFLQAEVTAIDVDNRSVDFVPTERPGMETHTAHYDYLVIAIGSRLAYDRIEGFAEYGDTVADYFHGNRLRRKLHDGGYRGGPVVVGSALFHQGDGANGLAPYPGGSIPQALAACEGPPVEVALSMATWLKAHGKGGPDKITITTPAEMIAEDAGERVVGQLLETASGMGFNYVNNTRDVVRLTQDGVEFENGQSLEAELKILLPDWEAHAFMRDLPVTDSEGFVVTNLLMRNPKYPEILAAGDAAAVTVPKLGAIGHQQCDIVGRQIARDLGCMNEEDADQPLQPEVFCIGDIGAGKGFYIRSNAWYGGDTQVLKMGRMPYLLKMQYRNLFFQTRGRMPPWGNAFAQLLVEQLAA